MTVNDLANISRSLVSHQISRKRRVIWQKLL